MSAKAERELAWRMDDATTDDRCVFAVIDGALTVGELKALIDRLEMEAEDRGYHRGYSDARRQYGPVLA